MKKVIEISTAAATLLCLFGCANDLTSQNDPYEDTNRSVFALNQRFDQSITRPVAVFYTHALPEDARNSVHNALANLAAPVTFLNDVLQGDASRASETLGRFSINSTLGVAGLFDVASDFDIPGHTADFGQTLAVYGVSDGPYLVLPFLGPDNPRDLTGQIVDIFFDPTTYLTFSGDIYWSGGRSVMSVVDLRSRNIGTVDNLESASIDLYAATRSLYRQYRQRKIRKGQITIESLPDL